MAVASMEVSRVELERIMEQAVKRTLTEMGVDTSDPTAMRRDFSALRSWREANEAIRRTGLVTLVSVVVVGSATLLWVGFRQEIINFFGDK